MSPRQGLRAVPVVLEDVSLLDFVNYILDHHCPPTTLIICSTREAFLHELEAGVAQQANDRAAKYEDRNSRDSEDEPTEDDEAIDTLQHDLTTPTLHLLATTRTVKLAFCDSLPHLHAYLSLLTHRHRQQQQRPSSDPPAASRLDASLPKAKKPYLAVLNPIDLHRHTSHFSAQGLNRMFAALVDSADGLERQLLIAECSSSSSDGHRLQRDEDREDDGLGRDYEADDAQAAQDRTGDGDERMGGEGRSDKQKNVWDEEVSMLNVTTKKFGAGEKGWAGRTVPIRRVVERWCVFDKVKG